MQTYVVHRNAGKLREKSKHRESSRLSSAKVSSLISNWHLQFCLHLTLHPLAFPRNSLMDCYMPLGWFRFACTTDKLFWNKLLGITPRGTMVCNCESDIFGCEPNFKRFRNFSQHCDHSSIEKTREVARPLQGASQLLTLFIYLVIYLVAAIGIVLSMMTPSGDGDFQGRCCQSVRNPSLWLWVRACCDHASDSVTCTCP